MDRPRPRDPEDRDLKDFNTVGNSRVERHFRDPVAERTICRDGGVSSLIPFCFVFTSSGVSASRSRSFCAHAIVQRVRELVCWDGADLRSRAQVPESAAKQAGE